MRVSASFVLILGCCYGAIDGAGNAPPIVKTSQGSLEGVVQQSRNNQTYYSFKGIPFAEYPGRFQVLLMQRSPRSLKWSHNHLPQNVSRLPNNLQPGMESDPQTNWERSVPKWIHAWFLTHSS